MPCEKEQCKRKAEAIIFLCTVEVNPLYESSCRQLTQFAMGNVTLVTRRKFFPILTSYRIKFKRKSHCYEIEDFMQC